MYLEQLPYFLVVLAVSYLVYRQCGVKQTDEQKWQSSIAYKYIKSLEVNDPIVAKLILPEEEKGTSIGFLLKSGSVLYIWKSSPTTIICGAKELSSDQEFYVKRIWQWATTYVAPKEIKMQARSISE